MADPAFAAALAAAKAAEQRTVRALLVAERATLRDAKKTVLLQTGAVVAASATSERHDGDEDRARASAHGQIARGLSPLAAVLTAALLGARHRARAAARAAALVTLGRSGVSLPEHPETDLEDNAFAEAAGASYAAGWASAANFGVRKRSITRSERARPASLTTRIAGALPATEGRIRRIAATETALAFNGELAKVAREANEASDEGRGGPYRGAPPPRAREPEERLVRVWSAMLDRKVCPECAQMHGTVVLAGQDFPGGDPPRHPFCRCVPVILFSALPLRAIEADWEAEAA